MATSAEPMVLSRSGVFNRLGSILSDTSSTHSVGSHNPSLNNEPLAKTDETIRVDTSFGHLIYRKDLSTIEHIHIRCRPASLFDSSIHTSLCEIVLGIFPDTIDSTSTLHEKPILVRGVVERRHRRVKVGDWLLEINGKPVNPSNIDDILSRFRTNHKIHLTIRHPIHFKPVILSCLKPMLPMEIMEERRVVLPEQIDCIHGILYYEKKISQGFKLLYQHPVQKDIFFASGGIFPALTQLMHDMNEYDSVLRSISIKLAEKLITICVSTDDNLHYLIIIYPPIENLNVCLYEQYTQHFVRLIKFLFGSISQALTMHRKSIEYFFDIFFYRFYHMSSSSSSTTIVKSVFKNIRLIDELLPSQFGINGACPKLILNDQQLIVNIDCLLNEIECQNINECSNENDFIRNRYGRIFYIHGCVLYHRTNLLITHLSNSLTNDIYCFLMHYGYLNLSQFSIDSHQLLLFKEIYPSDIQKKQRSFLIVCSQGDLTLSVIIESEYQQNEFNVSPDHELIQQIKLTLNEIYSIVPKSIVNFLPWSTTSPAAFAKKQLKRTMSLPSIGEKSSKGKVFESNVDDTVSIGSTDFRISQLVSQPESQDELYKSNRQSIVSSTLSIDEQQSQQQNVNLSTYHLHPGHYSTIFYYLDFQPIRGLLIAPYFSLDKLKQTTLSDRLLFETIQQTCTYIHQKHFSKSNQTKSINNRFSTKPRVKYSQIGCQFSLKSDADKKKKKDADLFQFWIVGKKCLQPIEHEFFVCYHDSIDQNITELAFTIGMSSV